MSYHKKTITTEPISMPELFSGRENKHTAEGYAETFTRIRWSRQQSRTPRTKVELSADMAQGERPATLTVAAVWALLRINRTFL